MTRGRVKVFLRTSMLVLLLIMLLSVLASGLSLVLDQIVVQMDKTSRSTSDGVLAGGFVGILLVCLVISKYVLYKSRDLFTSFKAARFSVGFFGGSIADFFGVMLISLSLGLKLKPMQFFQDKVILVFSTITCACLLGLLNVLRHSSNDQKRVAQWIILWQKHSNQKGQEATIQNES